MPTHRQWISKLGEAIAANKPSSRGNNPAIHVYVTALSQHTAGMSQWFGVFFKKQSHLGWLENICHVGTVSSGIKRQLVLKQQSKISMHNTVGLDDVHHPPLPAHRVRPAVGSMVDNADDDSEDDDSDFIPEDNLVDDMEEDNEEFEQENQPLQPINLNGVFLDKVTFGDAVPKVQDRMCGRSRQLYVRRLLTNSMPMDRATSITSSRQS